MISTKILDVQLQSASFTNTLYFQFQNEIIEPIMLKDNQPQEVKHFNDLSSLKTVAIVKVTVRE